MTNNLLYFPYIDIPKNSWTVKSILYWDKVGIIVPPIFTEQTEQFEDYTIELLKSDLVTQVFPYEYFWNLPNFENGFISLIEQPRFHLVSRQSSFARNRVSRIHVQKFGGRLLLYLEELSLAHQLDHQWFYVESKTARLLMMYLSAIISQVGEFTPATDDIRNLDTTLNQNNTSYRLSAIRQNLIDDLIPYPIEPKLSKLRKFKDKYHEELSSFRILIEKSAYEISRIRNSSSQTEFQKLVVEEINDKRNKILSDLNQSKFGQISFGTIAGISGALISFGQDNKPVGLISLSGAIYSAFQGYDKKQTLSKDYSYLALIDKHIK